MQFDEEKCRWEVCGGSAAKKGDATGKKSQYEITMQGGIIIFDAHYTVVEKSTKKESFWKVRCLMLCIKMQPRYHMVIPRFSIPIVLKSDLNEILTADDASRYEMWHCSYRREAWATTITEKNKERKEGETFSNILSVEISKHLGWYAWLDQNDTFHIHDIT